MLFGKYCLLERVSVGGMAEIFRAKPFNAPTSQKHLALKRILPHLAEDDEFVQMFIDEAKLSVQLVHPNIVRTYELGRFHTAPYILMEFISGQDLLEMQRQLRTQSQVMSAPMACHIVSKIAQGLNYVHAMTDENGKPLDIIHRDISPQNIVVTFGGAVKIIDFGIAKGTFQETHTQVGVLKGKFGYMSPEQVRGGELDGRSDLFTAGILLWELLTNRRLFRGDTEFDTLQLVREGDTPPPSQYNDSLDPAVDQIVARALAIDPEDRYQSGAEFGAALDEFVASATPSFEPERLAERMSEMFGQQLADERQKRQLYSHIRTPQDVRDLAGPNDQNDTEPDESTQDLWAADIAPDADVDADQFASAHTVVAAGGFDADKFATETEEEVIALDADDLIAVDGDDLIALDVGDLVEVDPSQTRDHDGRSPATDSSGQAHTWSTHGLGDQDTKPRVPNPSAQSAKTNPKAVAAAAALVVFCAAAGLTATLWVQRTERPDETTPKPANPAHDTPATLVVSVSPPMDLDIRLDGRSRGHAAPLTVEQLEPGHHQLDVSHPGFEMYETTVDLRPGGLKSVDIQLVPQRADEDRAPAAGRPQPGQLGQ